MSKIRILLVEDEPEEQAIISRFLEERLYEIAGIAASMEEAIQLLPNLQFDIALIDIFLGNNPDGIELATIMNEKYQIRKPFIFLTSSLSMSIFNAAKLTFPLSYLLKPFNPLELQYAIELAIERYAAEQHALTKTQEASVLIADFFFVKKANVLIKLQILDVLYFEVDGRYCKVYHKDQSFMIENSLEQLKGRLPELFIQTHRNYIINKNFISKVIISDQLILLSNDVTIPLSRHYKREFFQQFPMFS